MSAVSAAIVRLSAIVKVSVLTLCHVDVAFNSVGGICRCCFAGKNSRVVENASFCEDCLWGHRVPGSAEIRDEARPVFAFDFGVSNCL